MSKSETTTENSTKQFSKKTILIVVGSITVLLVIALLWLYTGKVGGAKQQVFETLPLPVAIVEGRIITSTSFYERVNLAEDLLQGTDAKIDNLADTILSQLIQTKKTESLAEKNNVSPTQDDIDNAFNGILKQFPNQDEQALGAELKQTYGIDLATFKNEVLRETVVKENLSLWHNRQESLNSETYSEARRLLSQLDSGADFDTVAQSNSEDPASTVFAGDSGFVSYNDLLPEFQEAVKDLAINDNKIVASRYGIHVLRINAITEGSDNSEEKNYNIQQIFLEPSDFNKWLDNALANMSSINLL